MLKSWYSLLNVDLIILETGFALNRIFEIVVLTMVHLLKVLCRILIQRYNDPNQTLQNTLTEANASIFYFKTSVPVDFDFLAD